MEIWTIIEEDHRRIEALLMQIKDGPDDREQLMRELRRELAAHTEGEEKALYPRLRKIGGFKQPIDHAVEEHAKLRAMLEALASARPEEWLVIHERLTAAFKNHVEEEERKIFPLAKKELPYHAVEHMKHEFEAAKHAVGAS